jgi:hypothetical protein
MAGSQSVLAAGPVSADELAAYCPDLDQWPTSWMYEERDVVSGRQMVECFKPFLRHLLSGGLSRKTLRRHRDNLWLLGGVLIRDLHETPRLRKRPIDQVVLQALDEEGGPLISHACRRRRPATLLRRDLSKVLSLPHRPQQFIRLIDSRGCGYVDNVEEALPTCPQPQQMQMPTTE